MDRQNDTYAPTDNGIRIRTANADDIEWITALAPRLHEFGGQWRDVDKMNDAVTAGLAADLAEPKPGAQILAAVDEYGRPLGFVSLRNDTDYFTGEKGTHVIDIVVAPAGEGQGVGRALLSAAEHWAKQACHPWLTLHVFAGNERARRIYEKAGYAAEWIRMVKPIEG